MTSVWDALTDKIRAGACSIVNRGYDGYSWLSNKFGVPDEGAKNAIESFNARFCNTVAAAPLPPLPFTGGQCCDVVYTVTMEATICDTTLSDFSQCAPGSTPQTQTYVGDIVGTIVGFEYGFFNWQRNSVRARTKSCSGVESTFNFIGFSQFTRVVSYSVVSIVRKDGQQDTCGDPPRLPIPAPEPGWNRRDTDVTYTDNNNTSVTIPVVLIYGQVNVDIDGRISVPVSVNLGGIDIAVNFNLTTRDINLLPTTNYYGDRRRGNRPTDYLPLPGIDIPDYPDSLPLPLPPLDEGEGEEEETIVGAIVTVSSVDSSKISTLFQSDNPNINIPSLGHISFLCRIGFMNSAWTSDIPVKNQRNLIACPWPGGAIRVAGTPQPGVAWEITPIYSTKEQ